MTPIAARAAALLLLAACGSASTGSGPTTSAEVPELDAASGRVAAVSEGVVMVEVQGVAWSLPASACLRTPGDADATGREAAAAAAMVRDLVADRASGWPTTTRPTSGDASFFVEINRWGPISLALGTVAGVRSELVASWTAFEQGYADPAGGWGPVTDIARRLAGWGATADLLVAALTTDC